MTNTFGVAGKIKKLALSGVIATTVLASGCASIISDSNYPVTLNSSPDGATFKVVNVKKGTTVMKGETPATITLSASNGYFSKAEYSVEFSAPGYEKQAFPLDASMDGWFLGNILFGGLIGILIIDPATGAMWKLEENMMVSLMKAEEAPEALSKANSLSIMTLDQVPSEMRDKMVRVN